MSSDGFYTLAEYAARNEYIDALSAEIVDEVTPERLYEQQGESPRYTLDECRGYYSIMYESGFE